jgi:hypothetical protein
MKRRLAMTMEIASAMNGSLPRNDIKEGLRLRAACADALVDVLVRGAPAPAALERHV